MHEYCMGFRVEHGMATLFYSFKMTRDLYHDMIENL